MSNLTLWTRRAPFADFDALVRQAFGPAGGTGYTGDTGAAFVPAAETLRDGDDAVVRVELPGLDPEKDVTVEVDSGRLVVRGERRDERSEPAEGESRQYHLREVRYGAFRRVFRLPRHVAEEAISASYDAGVLSVRVAGAYAGTEARKIPVSVA